MEKIVVTVLMAKSLIGIGGALLAIGGCLPAGNPFALFPGCLS